MKRFLLRFALFFAVLFLAACDSSTTTTTPDTNTPEEQPDVPAASPIVGTWEGVQSYESGETLPRRFVIEETSLGVYESSVFVCGEEFGESCDSGADVILATVTVEGNEVTISYVEAGETFSGAVTIIGTLVGDTITGEISAATTEGIYVGTITINKASDYTPGNPVDDEPVDDEPEGPIDNDAVVGTWEGTATYISGESLARRYTVTKTEDGTYNAEVFACSTGFGDSCASVQIVAISVDGSEVVMTYVETTELSSATVTIVGMLEGDAITGDITVVSGDASAAVITGTVILNKVVSTQ
ncbi:MAG: hypothetical protein ACRCYY_09400 [Trueperaceae bacterium]